jgi:hypothetical protein
MWKLELRLRSSFSGNKLIRDFCAVCSINKNEKGFIDEEYKGNSEKGREKMKEGVEGTKGGVKTQKRTVSR